MPRRTLDTWVRKLKTIEVLLTKHKESDIYNHMIKMHLKAEELFEKYDNKYRSIMKEMDDEQNHAYKKYNWRQGDPSRFWLKNADEWYVVDVSEDDKQIVKAEYMFLIYDIWSDFMICDKYIGNEWSEEKQEWVSMVRDIERIHDILKCVSDTIKSYELMDFCKYKTLWEKTDKDWIEAEKIRKDHNKNHPTITFPNIENIDKEPEPYPTQPLVIDCIHCKQYLEETKASYDRAIELWLKNKQEWEDWKTQQEVEDKKKKIKRENAVKTFIACFDLKEDLECDICNFKAKDEYEFDDHRNSVSHKKNCKYCKICNIQCRTDDEYEQHCDTIKHRNKEDGIEEVEKSKEEVKKSRYCEICNHQCRNDNEYSYHIETTKHKKNAGLIERVKIYKCNHCDYQSTVKCNFEKHIVSKNHL